MGAHAWCPRRRRRARWVLAAVGLLGAPALAVVPPPLNREVVDTSGQLSAADVDILSSRLHQFRRDNGEAIVVFVAGALGGEPVEDAAQDLLGAWGLGKDGQPDGVLLLISPGERQVHIEVGPSLQAQLTELECQDIIRNVIAPRVDQGKLREAVETGAQAIAAALAPQWHGALGGPRYRLRGYGQTALDPALWLGLLGLAAGLLLGVLWRRSRGGPPEGGGPAGAGGPGQPY